MKKGYIEMTEKSYLETLKSALGCSISHCYPQHLSIQIFALNVTEGTPPWNYLCHESNEEQINGKSHAESLIAFISRP